MQTATVQRPDERAEAERVLQFLYQRVLERRWPGVKYARTANAENEEEKNGKSDQNIRTTIYLHLEPTRKPSEDIARNANGLSNK